MEELQMPWGVVIGLLGVLAAPVIAFWAARRSSSGKIATSDATDLWQEGQRIRDFLNQQVADLRKDVERVTEEAKKEIERLENLLLQKELEMVRLRAIIEERDARITRLEKLLESRAV